MTDQLPKSVGWIGLGLMGYPMAKNLVTKLDQETHFFVYDVVQENVDKFVKEDERRVEACGSCKEVADKSDLIISMVPEGKHTRAVYLDEKTGVLLSDLKRKILIDCSTIDVESSAAVSSALSAKYPSDGKSSTPRFYDAPVSGGVIGAEKASLTLMLGASENDPHKTLLDAILAVVGKNIFYCGGPTLGLVAKFCNNYCSGQVAIGVSEALTIAIKSGMDPRVLANIFHTSTAQSRICDEWNPAPGICPNTPSSDGYKGGFRVQLMKKDIGLAVDTAKRVGVDLWLGERTLKAYEGAAEDERCRDLDSRVVYRWLGGVEDWNEGNKFGEVNMKRDETRRLLELGREVEAGKWKKVEG